MKYSLKVEYACRVLSHMGSAYGSARLFQINELAAAEQVPSKYLSQILNTLRSKNVIKSKRGKLGGYHMHRAPDTITLYEVVKAIDPAMVRSVRPTAGQSGAAVCAVWQEISDAFDAQLKSHTVSALLTKGLTPNWEI